jgi:hypothetical protein
MLVVSAVLAFILAGHLYDIARADEHWPFSSYQMFSDPRRNLDFEAIRLFGVPASGADAFPLLDRAYLEPFDRARIHLAFNLMDKACCADRVEVVCDRAASADPRTARICAAMKDTFERYASLHAHGRHDGPPLRAIELRHLKWHLDPEARNVDRPDVSMRLVYYAGGS